MGFKVFKEDDSFSMNNTKNMKKRNKKPRYYVLVACSNGKICFCKLMSYSIESVEHNMKLPLKCFVNDYDKKFSDCSIDKTLFTKINSNYIDDVDSYCDGLGFTNKQSKIIFDFLMSSEKNRIRFAEFCKDNNLKEFDFEIRL